MIVVFGSINLDLVAQVARLPRPGETLSARTLMTAPGGKGANQALAARRAGAEVVLHGTVGRDAFAEPALALLREAGVDLRGVRTIEQATGIALIHVEDSGENAITVIPGANRSAVASDVPDAALGSNTTLLLQLETPVDESLALATRSRQRGARVILNAAPAEPLPRAWFDVVDVLIVNQHEAATLARELQLPEDAAAFATALARRHPICTIVTLGAQGALAVASGTRYGVPAYPVACVDTVGAGDAFVGTLAAALDADARLPRALARASVAGALACTRVGAQPSFVTADVLAPAAATLESQIDVCSLPSP